MEFIHSVKASCIFGSISLFLIICTRALFIETVISAERHSTTHRSNMKNTTTGRHEACDLISEYGKSLLIRLIITFSVYMQKYYS